MTIKVTSDCKFVCISGFATFLYDNPGQVVKT